MKAINNKKIKEEDIPETFICAISEEYITTAAYDPRNPDVKYELTKIKKWIEKNPTCPYTRRPLLEKDLKKDTELSQEISKFIKDNGLKDRLSLKT